MMTTTAVLSRKGLSGRSRTESSPSRSWAPIWVRPVDAAGAVSRRSMAAGWKAASSVSSALASATSSTAGAPARLDEATRRLLRVPSLVAETAVRWGAGPGRDEDTHVPVRPARRRARRQHTRRPPSGLVRVVPAFGAGGGCDLAPGRPVAPAYRMSRMARLSLTLTVAAALVVLAAHALTSGGPTATTSVTVVAGDTLWSIAERSAPDDQIWATIDEISALNGLTGSDIAAGQVLVVPAG